MQPATSNAERAAMDIRARAEGEAVGGIRCTCGGDGWSGTAGEAMTRPREPRPPSLAEHTRRGGMLGLHRFEVDCLAAHRLPPAAVRPRTHERPICCVSPRRRCGA